jgi:CpeT/CpcT family (DUF1001)
MTSECRNWITGLYDNKKQAASGAAAGKFTAADGGHEYVSARIAPHPVIGNVVIASYYFDNDISKTFRYRFYEFVKDDSKDIIMKLHRPLLATEEKLKYLSYKIPEKSLPDLSTDFEYLAGCDVVWRKTNSCYKGTLINGECKLCSLTNPDIELVIKDELKLWKNALWINDRVYTAAGKQIIGNRDGIPYKMEKQKPKRDLFGAKTIYDTW